MNAQFSFTSPRQQLFSLPSDVFKSIFNNPSSSNGLMKLYQTCKYFYGKRPILIANEIRFIVYHEDNPSRIEICERDVTHLHDHIWITGVVHFDYYERSNQLPNFFRCSPTKLHFYKTDLKYEDFVYLTAEKTVTHCELVQRTDGGSFPDSSIIRIEIVDPSTIFFSSDPDSMDELSLDVFLSTLPNIRSFSYSSGAIFSFDTVAKLNTLKFNNKFISVYFSIESIAEDFDINLFCSFIKTNTNEETQVDISCGKDARNQMKLCLKKLDPKWKNRAHKGLKSLLQC